MTREQVDLEQLRSEVLALEARRDELVSGLEALRVETDDSPSDPDARPRRRKAAERRDAVAEVPPEPLELRPRPTLLAAVMVPFLLFVGLIVDHPVMWAAAAVFSIIIVALFIWPPRLTLDARGVSLRAFITVHEYRWEQLSDFRLSSKTQQLEVKTDEGWQSHVFARVAEDERLAVDACAGAWMASAQASKPRKRKRSNTKKKKRRRRDGLPR